MSLVKISITYFLYGGLSLMAASVAIAEWDVVGVQDVAAKKNFLSASHKAPKVVVAPLPKFQTTGSSFHSVATAQIRNSRHAVFPVQSKKLVNQPRKMTATIKLVAKVPFYALSISGSIKQNLEHILERYHWNMVWKAPYDYNFYGRLTGNSMPDVMEKLMSLFPLQAVIYMANKTILIVPRHKQND